MNLSWTQHARDVSSKRKIPVNWIEKTVEAPDWTCPDEVDPELKHYFKFINEFGNRILRVIVNTHTSPNRLITFCFDRNMKGKL